MRIVSIMHDGPSVRVTFERNGRMQAKRIRVWDRDDVDARKYFIWTLRKKAVEADRDIAYQMYPELGWPECRRHCQWPGHAGEAMSTDVLLPQSEIDHWFPEKPQA